MHTSPLLSLALLAATAAAAQQPAATRSQVEKEVLPPAALQAEKAPTLGTKVSKVPPSYAAVIAETDRTLADPGAQADPAQRATASIHKARAIETWASVDKAQAARYPEAIQAYRAAAQVGTPAQRALAQNNLGVLLLRVGNTREAVAELEKVDAAAASPSERAAYAFNRGRALEAANEPGRALEQYQTALAFAPGLQLAAERAYLLLASSAAWDRMTTLASSLVARGQAETAARLIRGSLQGSPPAGAVALLVPLVQAYALIPVSPARFAAEEWPLLGPLQTQPAPWPAAVEEMRAACSRPLRVLDEPRQASETFRYWAGDRARAVALSRLLKRIGDLRARGDDRRQALACYQHAWGIDPENTEAVLYMATLLRDRGELLDPEGKLLRSLVRNLFMEKGEAYARNDLPNVLRLHTVLGTIFEQQQRWGTPDRPDSALFQWTRAVRTAEQLRARDKGYPPTPGVDVHLATALAAVHEEERAGQSLLRAAEGFVLLRDREGARNALRRLDAIPASARSSDRARALHESVGPP